MYYAHSAQDLDESHWQGLKHHLEAVADRAKQSAEKFDAGAWAHVAGLLHDIGKYSDAFQGRLRGEVSRVDHSTAGAQMAAERWPTGGKLIAFCVAGHHAGLANGENGGSVSALADRLARTDIPALAQAWTDEIPLPDALSAPGLKTRDSARTGFQFAFFTRMLFSCLVDADYLDTEAFYAHLEGRKSARGDGAALAALKEKLDERLAEIAAEARQNLTDVNRQRAEILDHVRGKAALEPGLFSLTVPTGGGKTLTSLAFALDHAVAHGLDRVVYVIPFTSIVEQTAGVFRDALGEAAVLEHHSAFDDDEIEKREARDKLRLAMENWDAPIVVTTAVQFFESLFANRPATCRKLHNIARSVVILDEAQTLPLPLLHPCVAALDELALNYRTSVVLCTATQPALAEAAELPDGGFEGGLRNLRELAPEPRRLYTAFRRVTVVQETAPLDDAALAQRLMAERQVLCIVNNRLHARALYDAIGDGEGALHLTTLMCARHRSAVLARIKQNLEAGKPCRLVATSLIEAGVDVDFPTVYRAAAGIDSIAQAAGRCNREGRRAPDESRVVVFEAPDWTAPAALRQFAAVGRGVLRRHDDPLSLAAVGDYFREVYWQKEQGPRSELDAANILGRLGERARSLDFPFEDVARDFRVIESGLDTVIVPWDDIAKKALRDLEHAERAGAIARRLQPYVVQLPPKARAALLAAGAAATVRPDDFGAQFIRLENTELYKDEVGLTWDDPTYRSAVELVV